MFTDHPAHEALGHFGFTATAQTADGLYDPPVPSTVVDLYGPSLAVTVALMVLATTSGLVIVDTDTPHPCSLPHGCVHATVVLDGHIDYCVVRDAISAVFGQPEAVPTTPSPASNSHLN
ncbi:hypothetical protein ACIBSW_14070 [Actinoplanes sp. NPDC049668]|uniref:hypothetical protein n=1 Tax=unclassified Actinoplanes TaxID=2626549 RepID=UPI0033BE0A4C